MDAKQVPLRELLASVPEDARLVIDDADGKGTRLIPVGRLCQEAAAALAEPTLQTCNCRWDGEMQMQQCTLHEAHVDAIKEWAQRAKFAEKKLAALAEPVQEPVAWSHINGTSDTKWHPPQRQPLTEEEIWRTYKNLWMFHPAEEPRLAGDVLKFARAIERAHGIT